MSTKSPNPTDKHVGGRIKARRNELSISQEALGERLGVTFQQIQKYEKGVNRVGASRLQQISAALEVPISFFFEGSPEFKKSLSNLPKKDPMSALIQEFISSPDGLALAEAFSTIANSKLRRSIVGLVEQMAADAK